MDRPESKRYCGRLIVGDEYSRQDATVSESFGSLLYQVQQIAALVGVTKEAAPDDEKVQTRATIPEDTYWTLLKISTSGLPLASWY